METTFKQIAVTRLAA